MKWIKASERLPETGEVFVRYTDTNRKFVFNTQLDFKVKIDFDGYCYKKNLVEWLDEVAIDGQDAVAFAEWLKNDWVIKKGKYVHKGDFYHNDKRNRTTEEMYQLFINYKPE